MPNHEVLGGKVHIYRRGIGRVWQCSASVGGVQYRSTTKESSLELAKQVAEDWYLTLRGKDRAGLLKTGKNFQEAAEQFLKEYEIITEGQRSPRWVEGHGIRIRLHLLPFFGDFSVSEVTAGKVQEYRVHRISTSRTGKAPARSTLHDEIVTLRLILKTAIRHGWLTYLPDLSPPYRTQGKIVHRPWFSPAEYKQLYEATRQYAREPFHEHYKWNAEQVHDYVLFMANTVPSAASGDGKSVNARFCGVSRLRVIASASRQDSRIGGPVSLIQVGFVPRETAIYRHSRRNIKAFRILACRNPDLIP